MKTTKKFLILLVPQAESPFVSFAIFEVRFG